MAFNPILSGNLGGLEFDLPVIDSLSYHFGQAGIETDNLSLESVRRCAKVALRQAIENDRLGPREALDIYRRIGDQAVMAGIRPHNRPEAVPEIVEQ